MNLYFLYLIFADKTVLEQSISWPVFKLCNQTKRWKSFSPGEIPQGKRSNDFGNRLFDKLKYIYTNIYQLFLYFPANMNIKYILRYITDI